MPLVDKRFRTLDEGFGYIESFTNLEKSNSRSIRSYRLDRMRALLALFDNPQNAVRVLHIAGTKGKGSTGIYLATILEEAGYRTGFYASPHVSSYTERITLAGHPFEDALYVEMINTIVSRLADHRTPLLPACANPTTFELLTLLGFLMFREASCNWAVIETGIGGRLDATNVVEPEGCLLTPVEREHTELLGTTLAEIAGEKAGIIKPGVPVFSGYQHPDVRTVFERKAGEVGAPILFLADVLEHSATRGHTTGSETDLLWSTGHRETLTLAMAGDVQTENSALAILAIRSLFAGDGSCGPQIDAETFKRAVGRARLPGRMEIVSLPAPDSGTELSKERSAVPFVLDAAHTPVSVARLLDSFEKLFPTGGILIFGCVAGKDPEGMAEVLARRFRTVIISTPGTFKKSDPEAVWRCFVDRNPGARLVPAPDRAFEEAVRAAEDSSVPILVTGSFYMVAEIRNLLLRSS